MKAIVIILWTLSIFVITNAKIAFSFEIPEDANLNFTGLAKKYGHPAEEHQVVTEDGYILTLFHIPGENKTPVLLMHGIGDHADSFLVRGNRSLGVALANTGYDIWVGNLRGNKYARKHVKLNPDRDPKFWDFSFHESGYYDLPAIIDYVLNATDEKKLNTIGHSQGTSIHFVLLSTKPDYNEKLKLFIALAPVAYLNNLTPPISTLSEAGPLIDQFFRSKGIEELSSEKLSVPTFNNLKCGRDPNDKIKCSLLYVYYSIFFNPKTIEPEFFQVLAGHYPGTASRKSLVHYNQVALRKSFSNFDYGANENLIRYGNKEPPDYDLRKVRVNTALLVGRADPLATVGDAELLRKSLPNVVLYHLMQPKMWNHIDFIWRNDMDVHMFPTILELLTKQQF